MHRSKRQAEQCSIKLSLFGRAHTRGIYLRTGMTSFLCEQGADPFHQNNEGKTPYDIALASGH